MSETTKQVEEPVDIFAPVAVSLKNPLMAGFLAWLWPGAGHLYQGRYGKGIVFMVCILVTYFFGLAMSGGHAVYASFRKPDIRYPYIFQVGVGLPALPAIIQNRLIRAEKAPLFGSTVMAPPARYNEQVHDEVASWWADYGYFFELGSLYTMVAGLLNFMAVYDAYSGPLFTTPGKRPPPDETNSESR